MDRSTETTLSPQAALVVFDPLPLVDAWSRGLELALRAQGRWLEHCAELGWTVGLFALRRCTVPVELASRFGRQPTPDAAVSMLGALAAGTMGDLADEAARVGHIACAGIADAAAAIRGEARIAVEGLSEPAID